MEDWRALEVEMDAHTWRITITVTPDQATDLASGYVPNGVKSQIREFLDYRLEDERRAARPVKGRR